MEANPALKRLGFSESDRVVLIHTDDIGMCQSSVSAFKALWEAEAISCGATMVPCPWFNTVADYCAERPDVDMGVHATLTSEWHAYRWGPMTAGPGLADEEGQLHKTCAAVAQQATPEAVRAELEAQVNKARAASIPISHMDTHMGAVMHGPFYEAFADIALTAGIAPFALRLTADQWSAGGYSAETCATLERRIFGMEADGVPVLDRILSVTLADGDDRVSKTKAALSGIRPGQISYFILHPSEDTPETRAISPDWRSRVADFDMFRSGEIAEHLAAENIHVVGYRVLQELMPER